MAPRRGFASLSLSLLEIAVSKNLVRLEGRQKLAVRETKSSGTFSQVYTF